MKSGTWQFKAVLLGGGLAIVAAAAIFWPRIAFTYGKQSVLNELGDPSASTNACLAPGVRQIPAGETSPETVTVDLPGWSFSLPKDGYKVADGSAEFVGEKLWVKVDGVRDKRPIFKPGFAPSNSQVRKYLRDTDPYRLLEEAYSSTQADVEKAQTQVELQKVLYLRLLRAALQTHGAEKLWQRIEVRGRKGFLSGDESSKILVATIYLADTKEFAEIVILPRPGATMEDIYRCLSLLNIQPGPRNAPALGVGMGGRGLAGGLPGLPR